MLLKIAWNNIWRSKGRSLVVMGSIIIGVWALILAVGFMNGFMVGYMADIINHDVSNIQVHNPEFKKDFEVSYFIRDGDEKVNSINTWAGVEASTARVLVNGMIASPKKAAGIKIKGVDPVSEAGVTRLDSLIKEGSYFDGVRRNPVIIGHQLADDLNVKERSKVVLTFNDKNGEIVSAAFRVCGIIKSSSVNLSEGYAFVRREDLSRLLGMEEDQVHEIAILTRPHYEEAKVVSQYQETFPEDLAESWKEIAPELAMMQEMYGSMLYILMSIIMLALVFGIVNTMLMAVLERIKELGMLMAIGMNRARVFFMILLETMFLGVIGSPIGLFLGWITIRYFVYSGVDLSSYSEGLEAWGYDSILYPYVEPNTFVVITIGVFITSFIAAIYPSWKAVKLKPIEALHTV